MPVGCTDHNIVVIARKTKISKARPKLMFKRSYRMFYHEAYLEDVQKQSWDDVFKTNDADTAIDIILRYDYTSYE